jgi:hypothetical protein
LGPQPSMFLLRADWKARGSALAKLNEPACGEPGKA